MLKATIAIVSLLFVACVCVLFHLASAPAAAGMVSAVFLILLLVSTKAGAGSRSGGPRRSRSLRYAAPGLVVLLAYGLVWATPITPTLFNGVVTTLPLGTLTLADPTSVALDGQGDVYIADAGHHQIVEVSAAGVASVVAFPGLSPALFNPSAVALDGSGNLYVVDPHNVRVVELSAAGVASVVPTGGLLSLPSGLAIDAAGDLYIADQANNDIVEVADGTAAVLAITGLVTPLHEPAGLAVDASGNLYIADLLHGRIVVVAPGGAGSVLAITGLGTTNLYRPAGVAVDGLGNVYIADTGNSRVVTVTPQGVSAILGTGTVTLDYPGDVAVSAMGAVYIVDSGNNQVVEVMDSAVGFGHLFVPFATIFPTTLTLPFTIGSATYGSVQTFTQGTPGIDFSVASTTCVSGTTTGAACTVNVSFEPAAPGLRRGALVLFNNAVPPLPILTVLLYGIGDAPLAALSPGTASIISSGMVNALSSPQQVALDGAGNLYVANSVAENVLKIPPGGGSSSIVDTGSVNLETPVGVAVDGAGNLYIGDVGAYTHRIVEVTSAGVASVLTITGLVPPLAEPGALTVDAAGNLYIADFNRYVKVTPAGVGSVVATPGFTLGSLGTAKSIAVDAAGTVYLSDSVNNRVLKVTADGAASVVVPADIVPVLNDPAGVSMDGMGNLYIADSGNNRIVEVTTAGIASVVQTPALTSPATLAAPFATAVDNSGNVFVSDSGNNRVVEVSVAGASLAFPNTNVDSSSTAQTATVTNLGDLPLVFSANPSYTLNFSENTGDENLCAASSSLAPGTVCDVSVDFTPQSAGILSASIVATNNNLNNYFDATETVAVSGTGVSTGDMTAVTVSTNPATVILGQRLRSRPR